MFLSREQSAGDSPAAVRYVQHVSHKVPVSLGRASLPVKNSADLSVVVFTAFAERAAEHDGRRSDYMAASSKSSSVRPSHAERRLPKKERTQTA